MAEDCRNHLQPDQIALSTSFQLPLPHCHLDPFSTCRNSGSSGLHLSQMNFKQRLQAKAPSRHSGSRRTSASCHSLLLLASCTLQGHTSPLACCFPCVHCCCLLQPHRKLFPDAILPVKCDFSSIILGRSLWSRPCCLLVESSATPESAPSATTWI